MTYHSSARSISSSELVPTLARYVALWIALVIITAIIAVVPEIPVAIYGRRLSVAIGSVSGVIGLGLLQLGLLRFRVLRRPIDLYTGLAFGCAAVGNLFSALVTGPARQSDLAFQHAAYFLLLTRVTAVALFLTGLTTTPRYQQGSPRQWWRSIGLASACAFGVLSVGVFLDTNDNLPALLDPSVRDLLASGKPIPDELPGQQPILRLANVALLVALLFCTVGYTRQAQRLHDRNVAALAAALTFIFFAQVSGIVFPALPTDYVSASDALRLVAYVLLLSNALWRTGQDFAARATQNERLRVSRELHDGLAQQMAMLRLRLGRVADLTMPPDERSHDLEVAQSMLDSASLEVRRAIASLRSEAVRWQDFDQALQAFSEEFSLMYEVDGRVFAEKSDVRLDSQLQLDVLRILQEAFSNAARHGGAKQIDAVISIEGKALLLTVRDNGYGFDLNRARRGVGLRSIAERVERREGSLTIDSTPGRGTRIEASLPLRALAAGR